MAPILIKVAGTLAVCASMLLMLVSIAARSGAFPAAHLTPAMSFGGLVVGVLMFAAGLACLENTQ